MADEFTAKDLPLLNRLIAGHTEFRETAQVVKQVSAAGKFPINSFDDLTEILGGPDTQLSFRGQVISVARVREYVPAYYFPISSEADLLAKMSDIQARAGDVATTLAAGPVSRAASLQTEGVDIRWSGQHVSPPPGEVAPALTSAEIHERTRTDPSVTGIGSFG